MLTVYNLQNAISEASGKLTNITVTPYEFIGNLDEAFGEFNYHMMMEAVRYNEFSVGSDELITEAAISNPDCVDALSENVFTTIIENAKKIYHKILEMLAGLINTIKSYIAAATAKTDKWTKLMKSKVEEASRKPGASGQSASMHAWQVKFIEEELLSVADKIIAGGNFDVDKDGQIKEGIAEMNKMTQMFTSASADNDAVSAKVAEVTAKTEKAKEKYQNDLDGITQKVAGMLGSAVSSTSSMSAVYSDIANYATGGDSKETKYASNVGAMLSTIENSSKVFENIKNNYKKNYDIIDKASKSLSQIESGIKSAKLDTIGSGDDKGSKIPSNAESAIRSFVTNGIDYSVKMTNAYQTILNTLHSMDKKYETQMVKEYMKVLTKFAGFKGTKA